MALTTWCRRQMRYGASLCDRLHAVRWPSRHHLILAVAFWNLLLALSQLLGHAPLWKMLVSLGMSGGLAVLVWIARRDMRARRVQIAQDLAQRGLSLTERERCYDAPVTCGGCGAADLSVFYQGKTWGETWCEACYAARGKPHGGVS